MKLRIVVALFVLGITMTAVQCLAEEICGCLKPNSKHARIVDDVSECKRKEVAVVLTVAPTCEGTLSADGRWCDHGDGTITDMTTGLVWLQDANHFEGVMNWQSAMDAADGLIFPDDPAGYSDWRLPTVNELQSLIDYSQYFPALPPRHPFTNVFLDCYWTAIPYAAPAEDVGDRVWYVDITSGYSYTAPKAVEPMYAWPVRGGEKL